MLGHRQFGRREFHGVCSSGKRCSKTEEKRTNHRGAGNLQERAGADGSRFQIIQKRRRSDSIALSRRCRGKDSVSTHSVGAEGLGLGWMLTASSSFSLEMNTGKSVASMSLSDKHSDREGSGLWQHTGRHRGSEQTSEGHSTESMNEGCPKGMIQPGKMKGTLWHIPVSLV